MHKTYLALCFDLSRRQVEDELTWLPLIPAGIFQGADGRTWTNSRPDEVVASFTLKRPFDVEHATHLKAPKGDKAPAVGWVVALQNRAGEVWGQVKWNDDGRLMLDKEQYAFYSPAFNYDEAGTVLSLASVGLTNEPNLHQLPALNREENTVKLPESLTQALGLAQDATAEAAVAAVESLKQAEALALNRAQQPDLSQFVPKSTYDLALNRANTAEQQLAQREQTELEALVDDAISAGKVAPADRDMYLGLCRSQQGRDQFTAFVARAQPVVTDKQVQGKDTSTTALSGDELALCRKMGVKPDEYQAAKQAKQGE